jgi:hypothetical protein
MILTIEQLKQIVSAGGGLSLDASTMTFQQLKEIVGATSGTKSSITLKNLSGLTAGQLRELAGLAPGVLAFDLTAR